MDPLLFPIFRLKQLLCDIWSQIVQRPGSEKPLLWDEKVPRDRKINGRGKTVNERLLWKGWLNWLTHQGSGGWESLMIFHFWRVLIRCVPFILISGWFPRTFWRWKRPLYERTRQWRRCSIKIGYNWRQAENFVSSSSTALYLSKSVASTAQPKSHYVLSPQN